jgi:hypothetical protein
MFDQQLVSDIFKLRDRFNEMLRETHQEMANLPKSDVHSPETLNAAMKIGKRMMKLIELRRKAKELVIQTTSFPPKGSTE